MKRDFANSSSRDQPIPIVWNLPTKNSNLKIDPIGNIRLNSSICLLRMPRVSTESISQRALYNDKHTLVVHLLNYTLVDESGNYQLLRELFARIINWYKFVRESIRAAGLSKYQQRDAASPFENDDAIVKSRNEYGLLSCHPPLDMSSFFLTWILLAG